ncbi:hypothetical protein GXM_09055 [Nostoc sphaeroides CCNUC1]|uniref:Uncharacterized protein n=1 Tax=Nostoc sphaeroides CCNUC1 TaxID=2653204 RepID=A0A5P8WG61_9NOSO|nr:hypothetical protein GXM_09055 [Nostoc sphaeroides CCNUC1]
MLGLFLPLHPTPTGLVKVAIILKKNNHSIKRELLTGNREQGNRHN